MKTEILKIKQIKANPDNPRGKQFVCLYCGVGFYSVKSCKSRLPKFCSIKCYGESLKLHIKCKLCGNEIENKHSVSIRHRKYCSKKCQSTASKGIKLSDKWKRALSEGRKNSDKCKGYNLYNWKGGKETELYRVKQAYYKRKNGLVKKLDADYLKRLLIYQMGKCFYCEIPLDNYKAIEHLTPVSKGGDNDNCNLVYACKSCNSKKRQLTLEKYAVKINNIGLLLKWEMLFIQSL